MKNILVGALYDLGADYPIYKKLTEISLKRIAHFNPEIDEYVVLVNNNGVKSSTEMFREWFVKLFDLWKNRDTNILMIETDVLCHGSVMPLFSGDKFMMYSSGSAPNREEFNSGIVYFPATMDERLWAYWFSMITPEKWQTSWAFNQKIYDIGFKSQFSNSYELCRAEVLKYGAFGKYNWYGHELWKSDLPFSEAVLTHHFTSRGAARLLELYETYDLQTPAPHYRTF